MADVAILRSDPELVRQPGVCATARGAAHLGLSAGSLPKASAAQKDLDLAKRICRAMLERDRVPAFVTELRIRLTR